MMELFFEASLFLTGAAVYGAAHCYWTNREKKQRELAREIQTASSDGRRRRRRLDASWKLHESRAQREEARWNRVLDDLEWRGSREVVKH